MGSQFSNFGWIGWINQQNMFYCVCGWGSVLSTSFFFWGRGGAQWGSSEATHQGRLTEGGGTKLGSILAISLQQIEYAQLHAVHSNELVKSYTMKPMNVIFGGRYCEARRFFTSCVQEHDTPTHSSRGWVAGWVGERGGGGPLYYNQIDEGSNVVQ